MIVVFSIKIALDCENKMWLVYGYSNKIPCLTLHPTSRKEEKGKTEHLLDLLHSASF